MAYTIIKSIKLYWYSRTVADFLGESGYDQLGVVHGGVVHGGVAQVCGS